MAALAIGSRGSQLALWQARHIASRLAALGVGTRLEVIRTTGDRITGVPLAKVGAKGLFTKEIEEALLDGRIDLAVHSLKDLPTVLPAGLAIAAVPGRELPFDALVGSTLAALGSGARVGTSSLRRAAQLRARRPDLVIEDIRGNLDTRLRKLDEGGYDAILLAAAGLHRLGWGERIAELLPPEAMCPAVGQGALAVETRTSGEAFEICRRLDDPAARAAVTAERAVLRALGGGCQVPIGAHAVVDGGRLRLRAVVVHPNGGTVVARECEGPAHEAENLGALAAAWLLEHGARAILREVYGAALPLAGKRVVVTRSRDQSGALAEKLRAYGASVIELPAIEFAPMEDTSAAARAAAELEAYDWLVFTSANGVAFFMRHAEAARFRGRVCAVGPATAAAAENAGFKVDVMPEEFVGESVVAALSTAPLAGQRILLPRAAAARDTVPAQLAALGAVVDAVAVYRTVAPAGLEAEARRVFLEGPKPDWVTVTSGSTIGNLVAALGAEALRGVRVASIGPIASAAVRKLGLEAAVEAGPHTAEALAEAIARSETIV
jgi:hydroxymethylbilane synthase